MNRLRSLTLAGVERARSTRPVSWLTVLGVLLLPALVGGVLVAALYDPAERLDNMTAAIVNLDEPVTVQDQYTPLGRQLAAGLVEGSDDVDGNLTWVLSNEDDAAEGLADGTYQAVVTIPEEFSAAATSAGQNLSGSEEAPEQATIDVVTAPDARIVDEAIANQIASVATASMGRMLSEATLENVFIGYTTLGEQLGEAADGAAQLADGAGAARDGAEELAGGAAELGTGAGELASGARQLADGASQLAGGAAGVAGGAGALADGAQGVAGGAADLAGGASQLADGARQLATGLAGDGTAANPGLAPGLHDATSGAQTLASELGAGADAIERNGVVPAELTGAAAGAAQAAAGVADGLDGLSASCAASGAGAEFCAQLAAITQAAHTADAAASGTSGGLEQLATQLPTELAAQLRAASGGATELAGGLGALATGADGAAAGASQLTAGLEELTGGADRLSAGASQLAGGAGELSTGAAQLATGAGGLATGTSELASGATRLSEGAGRLATGTTQLGDGIGDLSEGTRSLADGLGRATEQIPSYSDAEAGDLATVLADPVSATAGDDLTMFGSSAVPLLAAVVLWFGGLATFVVMRSVTARALTSRRASALLAGGALLPAALVGAVQGVLVAAVIQAVSGYDGGTAAALFALCALIGVAFAAVHQALVAALGGAGRWVAALVGAIAIATGVVSTMPGWLGELADILPTAPAYRALLGAVTDAGGTGAAVTALLVWAVLAFAATTLAVARRRTIPAQALLAQPA
ncbi:YhgE/Pip domain-containing protein [Microbacterium sp. Root53]|uniref:YhgE/Pip domain-containing protein n=1 Tax=Microbacterium sp. Root53 TaxID=1736553 RepID=UPI000A7788BE|nr:YhgE/Pip domain-containing protein [Microbacterium sp. Root53]